MEIDQKFRDNTVFNYKFNNNNVSERPDQSNETNSGCATRSFLPNALVTNQDIK